MKNRKYNMDENDISGKQNSENEYLGNLQLNQEYSSGDLFVQVFDNVIKDEVCEDIIEIFEKHKDKQSNGQTAGGYSPQTKITKELYFRFGEPLYKFDDIIHQGLAKGYREYTKNLSDHYYKIMNEKYNWSKNLGDTGYQLQKYIKNEGRYKWHVDTSDELNYVVKNGIRKYAFIFYLNDVEEGGETGFIIDTIKNTKPKKGRLLIFPTTDQYVHCGFMPRSNDKYMITGWLHTKNKNT